MLECSSPANKNAAMTPTQANVVLRHIRGLTGAERISQCGDRELLDRFIRRRDGSAFEALLRRHGPMVLSVCRRILGNRPEVEDSFQAAFLVLANKARNITNRESVGGWLHRVAAHVALKARGRAATRQRHERHAPGRSPSNPLDELTARELLALLDEELRLLPERQRAPLVLCYLEGRPRDEAARQLGWSLGTLKRRLEEARRSLRSRLVRRGVTLSAALLAAELTRSAAAGAVPSALVFTTVRAALVPLSARAVNSAAIALAKSVLPTLGVSKAKVLAACALAACLLIVGVAMLSRSAPAETQVTVSASVPAPAQSLRVEEKPSAGPEQVKEAARAVMAISGQVFSPDGKAVSAADVAVVAWSHRMPREGEGSPRLETWAHGKTDEEGRFQMTPRRVATTGYYAHRHYQIAVLAGHRGTGVGWHFLKFESAKADVKVTLHPEQVRRGKLIDLKGQPAAGVRVDVVSVGKPAGKYEMLTAGGHPDKETFLSAAPPSAGSGFWEGEVWFEEAPDPLPCWPSSAKTDAEGRFTLHGVGRDQTVRIRIRGNEQVASELKTLAAASEAEPPELAISCGSPFFIEGTITDAGTGKPISKAHVHVEVAGAAMFTPLWPPPADWKGRQHCAGVGFTPSALPVLAAPSESGLTDERGHYRISAFRSDFYKLRSFAVVVTGAEEKPYFTVKKTIRWPKGAIKQQVDVSVPRGVLVRGRVVEQPSEKPVADARIDFYQKGMKFRTETDGIALQPDGVLHPYPRVTDVDGSFQIIVPPGRSYLLVNGPTRVYTLDTIAPAELGIDDPYPEAGWTFIPPGSRAGKKPSYYPDRAVKLDAQTNKALEPISVTLRRAPVLKGRVVGPDGDPAVKAKPIYGQAPFMEPSSGGFAMELRLQNGEFSIPVRNPDTPLCLLFTDTERNLGAAASFTPQQAEGEPVTVRLAPCGSVSFRLLDAAGKPLADEQPALWLSLPAEPYSAPRDLEKLIARGHHHWNYDAIWSSDLKTRTDMNGRITISGLVPGAAYRLLLSDGKAKDFQMDAGKSLDLGDLTIAAPDKLREPKAASK
jgi:RNA polymerase sigma factor (sigma-70 family)